MSTESRTETRILRASLPEDCCLPSERESDMVLDLDVSQR